VLATVYRCNAFYVDADRVARQRLAHRHRRNGRRAKQRARLRGHGRSGAARSAPGKSKTIPKPADGIARHERTGRPIDISGLCRTFPCRRAPHDNAQAWFMWRFRGLPRICRRYPQMQMAREERSN
jgi:hypothetical protein